MVFDIFCIPFLYRVGLLTFSLVIARAIQINCAENRNIFGIVRYCVYLRVPFVVLYARAYRSILNIFK